MDIEEIKKFISQAQDEDRNLIVFGRDFTARGKPLYIKEIPGNMASGFRSRNFLFLSNKKKELSYDISKIIKLELDEESIPRGTKK